mmetsp:Transcript_30167/g.80708  ORF Transcript_30167/g.80708 Transcript_30167/m.80708 type:complete len:265 (+) Transcript_30167:1157-1951(+)
MLRRNDGRRGRQVHLHRNHRRQHREPRRGGEHHGLIVFQRRQDVHWQTAVEGTVRRRRLRRRGPGQRARKELRAVVFPRAHIPLEALVRLRAAASVLWRVPNILHRPGNHRGTDCLHWRPGLDARLRHRDGGQRHRDHHRGHRHFTARHVRIQDGGHTGRDGRRQHRERHGEQLRQRLPGPGPALDAGVRLLGHQGGRRGRPVGPVGEAWATGRMVPQPPGHPELLPRHLRGPRRRPGHERRDLHRLRNGCHRRPVPAAVVSRV